MYSHWKSLVICLFFCVLTTAISFPITREASAQVVCPSGNLGARLSIDRLQAFTITGDEPSFFDDRLRDEIYVMVIYETPRGDVITEERLPFTTNDRDYYGFFARQVSTAGRPTSWTNSAGEDRPQRPPFPQIWEGTLGESGARVDFRIQLWEQDSEFGRAEDDFIGTVLVNLQNIDGVFTATFQTPTRNTTNISVPGAVTFTSNFELPGGLNPEFEARGGDARYRFRVAAQKICLDEVPNPLLRHKLWANDVENGNCDNGQPLSVELPDSSRVALSVGDFLTVPDAPSSLDSRSILYFCDGSREPETGLFDRNYDEFLIERTRDEVRYNPYTFEGYPVIASVGGAVEPISDAATVGLYRWFSEDRGDNWTNTLHADVGERGEGLTPDYRFSRLEGRVYSPDLPQPPGTIPMYRWFNEGRGDNWTTTLHNDVGDRGDPLTPNYSFSRLVGYLYPPDQQRPAVPHVALYRWFNPNRGDNWTTSLHNDIGERGEPLTPDYRFVRLEGYILRP